jgi:homoserine kinase
MSGARRSETFRRIENEIAAEKAAALGRAGERLEAAMDVVAALAARAVAVETEDARSRLAAEYTRARARALGARLALLIQREALGLRRHAVVDQHFPEPPPFDRLRRGTRTPCVPRSTPSSHRG